MMMESIRHFRRRRRRSPADEAVGSDDGLTTDCFFFSLQVLLPYLLASRYMYCGDGRRHRGL